MGAKLLTWVTTFVIITLCELGDKTQVAVLLITSKNPAKRWLIFLASALALTACVAIEVTAGVSIARYLPPALINRLAGIVFLVLGGFSLLRQLVSEKKISLRRDITDINP